MSSNISCTGTPLSKQNTKFYTCLNTLNIVTLLENFLSKQQTQLLKPSTVYSGWLDHHKVFKLPLQMNTLAFIHVLMSLEPIGCHGYLPVHPSVWPWCLVAVVSFPWFVSVVTPPVEFCKINDHNYTVNQHSEVQTFFPLVRPTENMNFQYLTTVIKFDTYPSYNCIAACIVAPH